MGSTNRDYMRDDFNSRGSSWGSDVPTTKWLIIITVGLFFCQTIFTYRMRFDEQDIPRVAVASSLSLAQSLSDSPFGPPVSYVEEWLSLSSHKVWGGQFWRLLTYAFCHHRDAPFNLAFNMIALWYLGSSLERMYGSREFLWFYLMAALACGVIFALFGLKLFLPFPLIGSNASILACLALYASHFPRREIYFFGLIPIQVWILLLIFVVIDVYVIIQAFAAQTPWIRVAYLSELWGAGFGYFYFQQGWRFAGLGEAFDVNRLKRTMRRASTARTLKVYSPETPSNLDEQVDAILAKIHDHGSESLTERERAVLQRASDRAKQRN